MPVPRPSVGLARLAACARVPTPTVHIAKASAIAAATAQARPGIHSLQPACVRALHISATAADATDPRPARDPVHSKSGEPASASASAPVPEPAPAPTPDSKPTASAPSTPTPRSRLPPLAEISAKLAAARASLRVPVAQAQAASASARAHAAATRAKLAVVWKRALAHPVLGPVLRLLLRLAARVGAVVHRAYSGAVARLAARPAAQSTQLALAAEQQVAARLGTVFGPDRSRAAAALGLALLAAAATLALPWAAGGLVDAYAARLAQGEHLATAAASAGTDASHSPSQGGVWGKLSLTGVAAVLLVLLAARAGGQAGGSLLFQLASVRTVARLRNAIASRLVAADAPWAQAHARVSAQRANKDLATLTSSLSGSAVPLVGQGAVAAGSAVALVSSAPVLAALLAVMVPVLSRATYVYERFLTHQATDVSALRESVGGALEHSLPPAPTPAGSPAPEPTQLEKDDADAAGYLTMKRLGKEGEVTASLARHAAALEHAERTQAQAWGIHDGGAGLLGNGVALALLGYGGVLVARGTLSPGALVSLALYTALLGSTLAPTRAAYAQTADGLAAAQRLFDLLEPSTAGAASEARAGSLAATAAEPLTARPTVEFRGVTTRPGAQPALHNADITVPAGRKAVFIVPPANAGTLKPGVGASVFDLVQGLALPHVGEVRIDNALRPPDSLRTTFVAVEAVPAFGPDETIAEAVASGASGISPGTDGAGASAGASDEQVQQALQWAQCEDLRSVPGLDARAASLPVAAAWRVGLARALVRAQTQVQTQTQTQTAARSDPPVLLLDLRGVERAAFARDGEEGAYLVSRAVEQAASHLGAPVWIISSLGSAREAWTSSAEVDVTVLGADGTVRQSGPLREVDLPGSAFQTMLAHAQLALSGGGQVKPPPQVSVGQHRLGLAGLDTGATGASGPVPSPPSPVRTPGQQQTVALHTSASKLNQIKTDQWSVAQATTVGALQTLSAPELATLHLHAQLAPPHWPGAPATPGGLDEMVAMFDSVQANDRDRGTDSRSPDEPEASSPSHPKP